MDSKREQIVAWFEAGAIPAGHLDQALRLSGVRPDRNAWRVFLERLLLWGGALLCVAGAIYFFAYNWRDLGTLGRFGLAELLLAVALLAYLRAGADGLVGRAALFSAALLAGALLALFGQTYQTGADSWQLFAGWALAILPWTLVGRLPLLWLLQIGLVNLVITLYFQLWPGHLWWWNDNVLQLWLQFACNLTALIGWELASGHGGDWLRVRWLPRLLALGGGICITWLTVLRLFDDHTGRWLFDLAAFCGWSLALLVVYRRLRGDLFILSGAVLGGIVVVTALLSKLLLVRHAEAGGLLLIALAVIGMAAGGGLWLKLVAAELQQ